MGMFDSYNNLDPNYIPNNIYSKCIGEYITFDLNCPKKVYDIRNRFIGYGWNYRDTFELSIDIDKLIYVDSNIIYTTHGEGPAINTEAKVGQKAYNIVDIKSWTCTARQMFSGELTYTWLEDDQFTYPECGDIAIKLSPDMAGKKLSLYVYNFRHDLMHTFTSENSNILTCKVDAELSEKFIPGVYYCILKLSDEDEKMIDKFQFIIS